MINKNINISEEDIKELDDLMNNNKSRKKFNILYYILIIVILFFGLKIAKRLYFNEFYYEVPNFIGIDYELAKKELGSSKISLRPMGETFSSLPFGAIAIQDPIAGSIVKRNRNIKVWISKAPQMIFIPDLIDMNILDAISIAKQQGLKIGKITKIESNYGINKVIATSLRTGEPVPKGETISFLVSL